MYVSAVMYPISLIQEKLPEFAWLVAYNPLAYIIDVSRYLLLSTGEFSASGLIYTVLVTFVILIAGMLVFNRTEKNFIDTV